MNKEHFIKGWFFILVLKIKINLTFYNITKVSKYGNTKITNNVKTRTNINWKNKNRISNFSKSLKNNNRHKKKKTKLIQRIMKLFEMVNVVASTISMVIDHNIEYLIIVSSFIIFFSTLNFIIWLYKYILQNNKKCKGNKKTHPQLVVSNSCRNLNTKKRICPLYSTTIIKFKEKIVKILFWLKRWLKRILKLIKSIIF